MTIDNIGRQIPPYVSYECFTSLISPRLVSLPNRIDLNYILTGINDEVSVSTATQLMHAMRFLNLIDENNRPNSRLKLLVSGTTQEHRAILLRHVAYETYAFIFKSRLDIQNATYADLETVFQNNYPVSSDTCRKCIKFFVDFCNDAGIPLSPQKQNTSQKFDTRDAMYSIPTIAPGAYLKEELAARDISWPEFARRTGISLKEVDEIIKGKKTITAGTALQLEQMIPTFPARFWLYLQSDFQLGEAIIAKQSME